MTFFKKVFGVMKFSAKESFTYRFNFIIDLFMLPIYLIINYFVWSAIYSHTGVDVIRGYTLQMLISYYVAEMFVSMLIWTQIDENIASNIRKGKLTQKLLRPMGILERHLYGLTGGKSVNLLFHAGPILIIGIIFFGVRASWMSLWAIPVMILAYFVNYLLVFLTGTLGFWMQKITGLVSLRRMIMGFLAGGFIPLTFMPHWFQNVSWFMPFQYTKFLPINTFLGSYNVHTILLIILAQIGWIAVLYILYRIVWRAGINKYTGAGQ
jgi:ABC-2 type transport system permease protein